METGTLATREEGVVGEYFLSWFCLWFVMDVLRRLREAKMGGLSVTLEGSELVFPDGVKVGRAEKTAFFGKKGGGDAYAADSVWSVAMWGDRPLREYMGECERAGVVRVQMMDLRDLLPYLKGESEAAMGIREVVAEDQKENLESGKKEEDVEEKEEDSGSDPEWMTMEVDPDRLARALKRERVQRPRDSILSQPDVSYEPILKLLMAHVEKRKKEEYERRESTRYNDPKLDSAKMKSKQSGGKASFRGFDPRGDRYNVANDTVWREVIEGGGIEGIDTAGSFKQKVPLKVDESATKTISTIPAKMATESPSKAGPLSPETENRVKKPIIMLPTGASCVITAENAVEFFANGKFRMLQRSLGPAKMKRFVRTSPKTGTRMEFVLASHPGQLEANEWAQVVAVVCSGAEWQFKGWPFPSSKEALRSVKGYYFYYDDDKRAAEAIKDWNLVRIPISKTRRHLDEKVSFQFWDALDRHIAARHPTFAV